MTESGVGEGFMMTKWGMEQVGSVAGVGVREMHKSRVVAVSSVKEKLMVGKAQAEGDGQCDQVQCRDDGQCNQSHVGGWRRPCS